MNAIVRNFVHVIRRFKLATILNILGLSVAFAAFMVIMMQLNFHFSFDRFHENSDRIFRLEVTNTWRWAWSEDYTAHHSRPFAERFIASSPHIVTGALTAHRIERTFFIERDEQRHFVNARGISVTPEFTDVIPFDFVEGSAAALRMPDHIMIPQSLARLLFGNESAIGKQLVCDRWAQLFGSPLEIFTIGAVYRDFANNSIFSNYIFSPILPEQDIENWEGLNYNLFVLVNNAYNVNLVIDNFKRHFVGEGSFFGNDFDWEESGKSLRLTPLPNIHFATNVADVGIPKVNIQTLLLFFAIALVIILIAAINFTNFSAALTPMRIRNINTQRVLGAQQRTIRWMLVFEAIAFSFVSYLMAILFVHLFVGSLLANLIEIDLSIAANLPVILGVGLVAIVVGALAGLYPSRYMTSFAPALALKGNFALSPKGKKIRNTLIGIQFVASLALIIGASFMYLQNRFMQHSDFGFDREALIVVDISRAQEHRDVFTHQLNQHSWIEGVTYSSALLSAQDRFSADGVAHEDGRVMLNHITVDYNFLQTMGIEVTAGRDFRQEDGRAIILNETARRLLNPELNTTILESEIVGFMPDIHYTSFRVAIEPMAFRLENNPLRRQNHAYIRLSSGVNPHQAITQIRAILAEFEPNYPFNVRFFDEVLQQLYEDELRLSSLILIFSLIAILISIVGVFGLVVFDSECRRKEIGIRKVMGATALEIVAMFNKAYIKILLICFVIAVPVAWIAVSRWLENFAYHTPMYWWVFVLAFIAVAVITALTVTVQNWRVANEDPVKSIKTE